MNTEYRCVTTADGIRDYIGGSRTVAFDFETAPDDPYREEDKAALDPARAHIVGCSFSIKEGTGIYVPIAHRVGTNIYRDAFFTFLKAFLMDRTTIKIAHNIAFQGLWNGIANIKDWLIQKIRGLGSAITGALKTVLGINSPSKVFEKEIGVNLGLGVGVGFEKAMKTVKDDMADAIPTDFDLSANVKSAVNTSGLTGGFALYLTIENFYNNSLQDIRQLAEELSAAIAGQVNRKAQAF